MRQIDKQLDNEVLDYFVAGTTERNIDKNKTYIDTFNVHSEIGFVIKGLFRGYYIDEKGKEINTRFNKEGGFVTHYKAFISKEPSKYVFMAVEPSVLLCFSYTHLIESYKKYPKLERFGRLMAEAIIRKMDGRLESHHFDDATKRYSDFLKEYPDLNNRLSLKQIASYIGITRPALSRLRAKKW